MCGWPWEEITKSKRSITRCAHFKLLQLARGSPGQLFWVTCALAGCPSAQLPTPHRNYCHFPQLHVTLWRNSLKTHLDACPAFSSLLSSERNLTSRDIHLYIVLPWVKSVKELKHLISFFSCYWLPRIHQVSYSCIRVSFFVSSLFILSPIFLLDFVFLLLICICLLWILDINY